MAVLAECPMCHKKQKVSNKLCYCGADLDKIKKNNSRKMLKQRSGTGSIIACPAVSKSVSLWVSVSRKQGRRW